MIKLLFLAAASPELFRLASGVPVVVEPIASANTVSIQMLLRSDDLSPTELSALEIVAASITVESESFSAPFLKELAWFVGNQLDIEVTATYVRIGMTTDSSHFAPAVSLLADIVKRTSISPKALEHGLKAVSEARARFAKYSLAASALRFFAAELDFGPVDLSTLSEGAALAVYAKVFRPERAAIGVAGPVKPSHVAKQLSASFANWKPPPVSNSALAAKRNPPSANETNLTVFMAGIRGPGVADPAFPAWLVLMSAVGLGKASHIAETFRSRLGLAYETGIEIAAVRSKSIAIAYVLMQTTPEAEQRLATLRECIRRSGELTAADVERAKQFLLGRYLAGSGTPHHKLTPLLSGSITPRAKAFHLAWWEAMGGSFKKAAAFSDLVKAVTHDQVKSAADAWLGSAAFKLH